jgi:2-polyprenyl-6-methoxyphenol hydroxylase-like FAD-dependent oxidoreductase
MKIVIIGGVAGGATAAARLRRNDEGAEIVLVERGPYISFANCGLPYHISGAIPERDQLLVTSEANFEARYRVDVRSRTEAKGRGPARSTQTRFVGRLQLRCRGCRHLRCCEGPYRGYPLTLRSLASRHDLSGTLLQVFARSDAPHCSWKSPPPIASAQPSARAFATVARALAKTREKVGLETPMFCAAVSWSNFS